MSASLGPTRIELAFQITEEGMIVTGAMPAKHLAFGDVLSIPTEHGTLTAQLATPNPRYGVCSICGKRVTRASTGTLSRHKARPKWGYPNRKLHDDAPQPWCAGGGKQLPGHREDRT